MEKIKVTIKAKHPSGRTSTIKGEITPVKWAMIDCIMCGYDHPNIKELSLWIGKTKSEETK